MSTTIDLPGPASAPRTAPQARPGTPQATGRCARPPGRPRNEQAERAIIEAVVALLAGGTAYGELSMEAIATRAGVGRATLYRRWPTKEALVIDALASLDEPIPTPTGTSVRDDLLALLEVLTSPGVRRRLGITGCLLAARQRHPELGRRYEQQVIEPRRDAMRQVLRRGIEAGQLRPDLDIELALQAIASPLVLQAMGDPAASPVHGDARRLVDLLLEGMARR